MADLIEASERLSREEKAALLRARRTAREMRSFYGSLSIYVPAVVVFWTINALTVARSGTWWAVWPTLAWGASLVFWAVSLFGLRQRGGLFGPDWEERKVQAMMAGLNLKRESSERRLVQAQLRMLQAQIEPHFLFNTLANVQSLVKREPDTAQRMLDQFISYLRQSLSASRNENGTLGQELNLLRNYLELLRMRMGERLRYTLAVPETLHNMPLAPMLLQPLVENAIRHGLEPKAEGGSLSVTVREAGDQCIIEVHDDGLGIDATSQKPKSSEGGLGLSNLRERLAVLYDGRASLELIDAQPGTVARLTLPRTGN